MFGDFAGKLDRHFFIGHFFPSLLFIGLNLGFEYVDILPFAFLSTLKTFDMTWAFVLVLIASLFLGMLLAALNRPIIMLYEGYPFRAFRLLVNRQTSKWHKLNSKLSQLTEQYRMLPDGEKDPQAISLQLQITELRDQLNNRFPPEAASVLPTRLGNAIRAFESYADERYRIDPITFWSRLLPVLPEKFFDKLQDVTTSFNFLINIVLLTQIFALEMFAVGIYYIAVLPLFGTVVSLLSSYFLYRAAVSRAIDWGFMFNTAFDLYRRDLLKQLGFRPPKTIKEERELWDRIWYLIMYRKTEGLEFSAQDLTIEGEGNAPTKS